MSHAACLVAIDPAEMTLANNDVNEAVRWQSPIMHFYVIDIGMRENGADGSLLLLHRNAN